MRVDLRKLRYFMIRHFTFDDLQALCFALGVNFDVLSGDTLPWKVRDLIVLMQRHERLDELVETVRLHRSIVFDETIFVPDAKTTDADVTGLDLELASLRQQLVEIQEETLTKVEFDRRLDEMLRTANRAIGRSAELTARIILPQQEEMDVHLVPSHSLERLEEYRSDENVAYLFIGLFGGAILGILSNWVTDENFVITRFSVMMMLVFLVLTVACVVWSRRIRRRANLVKDQMLHDHAPLVH